MKPKKNKKGIRDLKKAKPAPSSHYENDPKGYSDGSGTVAPKRVKKNKKAGKKAAKSVGSALGTILNGAAKAGRDTNAYDAPRDNGKPKRGVGETVEEKPSKLVKKGRKADLYPDGKKKKKKKSNY